MKETYPSPSILARGSTSCIKSDHRGLTLVELIVAFALLGMVASILMGFIRTGSMMYRRISANLSLQVQSQLALAQLQEYIIDANGLYYENNTLYIYDTESSDVFCHLFQLDSSANILYYERVPALRENPPRFTEGKAVMAENVTAFTVSLTPTSGAGTTTWTAKSAKIFMDFSLLEASYNGEMNVALRSRPQTPGEPGADKLALLHGLFFP